MNYHDSFVLANIMYDVDPGNTCCKENECTDEYDSIAAIIVDELDLGIPIETAISEVYVQFFNDEISESDLKIIIDRFNDSKLNTEE